MFPSIEQLQAIYKTLNGEEAGDVHRLRAAHHFNVDYLEVTPEQRAFGKTLNLGGLYSGRITSLIKQTAFGHTYRV